MENKRPAVISTICIIGFVVAIGSVPLIIFNFTHPVTPWYPIYYMLFTIFELVSMIGLWKMKKWSVITYASLAIIHEIVLAIMGNGIVWWWLIIPAIVVLIMRSELKNMTW